MVEAVRDKRFLVSCSVSRASWKDSTEDWDEGHRGESEWLSAVGVESPDESSTSSFSS